MIKQKNKWELFYDIWMFVAAVYCISTLFFIHIEAWYHRTIFFFLAMVATIVRKYIFPPAPKLDNKPKKKTKWGQTITLILDILFIITIVVFLIYTLVEGRDLQLRTGFSPKLMDLIISAGITFLVIEMGRRTTGWVLPLINVLLILYCLLGQYLPGSLNWSGISFSRMFSNFYSISGLFGSLFSITLTYVIIFVMFGTFLKACGSSSLLIRLCDYAFGKLTGGSMKVAVAASAMMGMVTGSTVSNVVATGSLTIPMMRESGIDGETAGAVSAVGSTGGQIMPPIMGAAAFIMAENIGLSYNIIAVMAIGPALWYYVTLFFQLHLYAKKNGIKGLPEEKRKSTKQLFKKEWYLLIPVLVLIVLLFVVKYSALMSGAIAALSCVVVSWFNPSKRMGFKQVAKALIKSASGVLTMTAICTMAAGIVILLNMSGLAISLTSGLISLGANNLFLALLLTAVITIILGMGMPTVPAYALTAVVGATALMDLGIPTVVAHFYCFYFACMSSITPPIALGAYAASSISGCSPYKTGWKSLRLGLAGLLAPFLLVFRSSAFTDLFTLLGIYNFMAATIGLISLAIAMEGYLFKKIAMWRRFVLGAGFLLLAFFPIHLCDAIGFFLIMIIVILEFIENRKNKIAYKEETAAV